MSYQEDIAAIAAVNAQVLQAFNGVAYDSTNLPAQINTLPCAMVITAPGNWSKAGGDEYVVRVYVAQVLNGNPATSYAACVQLMDVFHDTYTQIASINGRALLRGPHGSGKTPSGLGTSGFYYTQRWSSQEFYGFEIYLPLQASFPLSVPTVEA